MNPDFEAVFEYQVESEDECLRLDKFITGLFTEYSRTTIQKLIDGNLVLLNGKPAKPSVKVKVGDVLAIGELPITDWEVTPENIPLEIVYEDEELLVVNKPSGMVVHPAPGHYSGTLVNALLFHIQSLPVQADHSRPGIVHRIDKDTSGLLMVAKTDFAHQTLQEELRQKLTKRVYIALVDGVILNQKGTVEAPIGRDVRDRKKMAISDQGKPAITHFQVLERFPNHTLIECRLETGRTHQIRVHMAYIGYPLCGDYVYGLNQEINDFGQFLHARVLGFTHPRTKEWLEFESPIPSEFQRKLQQLSEN